MGNCLFDSLKVFIGIASSHALRLALCQYVREHTEQFEASLTASGYRSVDQYVRKMSVNGVDGDHHMICAAALLYNLRVHVHMPNGRVFTEEPAQVTKETRSAHLKWVPGHYSVAGRYRKRRVTSA